MLPVFGQHGLSMSGKQKPAFLVEQHMKNGDLQTAICSRIHEKGPLHAADDGAKRACQS